MWCWPWEPVPRAGCPCHQETFHSLQPLLPSCLLNQLLLVLLLMEMEQKVPPSLPLALLPGPRPKANLQAKVTGQSPPPEPPWLLPHQGFIMDHTPQFQAQLLSLQSCSLTNFLQIPHLCCAAMTRDAAAAGSSVPSDCLTLCLCHALFLATLRSPILETISSLTYHIFFSFPSAQSPVLLPLKSIRNSQGFQRERQDIISGQFPTLS